MLRELLLPEGGFASAQDADTDGVEGLTFTWTPDEGVREELLQPFEDGRSVIRGELSDDERARLFELREQRPKPLRDDKAITAWNGLALAALAEAGRRLERADYLDAARRLGEFILGPLSDGRPPAPHVPSRRGQGHGLPRGLRGRRARAARAARGDGRAALAPGGEPAGPPRSRALRRRRARRLLPLARRRRGARRAQEGPRGPPDAVGQLDARLGAAPPGAHLRGRRARAPRSRSLPARPRRRHPRAVRVRACIDGARPPLLAAP